MQDQCWTKKIGSAKGRFLHIRSCGYAAACPQADRFFTLFSLQASISRQRRPSSQVHARQHGLCWWLRLLILFSVDKPARADGDPGRQSLAVVSTTTSQALRQCVQQEKGRSVVFL
jgi:hypothetical protein